MYFLSPTLHLRLSIHPAELILLHNRWNTTVCVSSRCQPKCCHLLDRRWQQCTFSILQHLNTAQWKHDGVRVDWTKEPQCHLHSNKRCGHWNQRDTRPFWRYCSGWRGLKANTNKSLMSLLMIFFPLLQGNASSPGLVAGVAVVAVVSIVLGLVVIAIKIWKKR